MDEAARTPASKSSPCPRDSARSVLTGRRPRTERAAEDVGPYHRSAVGHPAPRGVMRSAIAVLPRFALAASGAADDTTHAHQDSIGDALVPFFDEP